MALWWNVIKMETLLCEKSLPNKDLHNGWCGFKAPCIRRGMPRSTGCAAARAGLRCAQETLGTKPVAAGQRVTQRGYMKSVQKPFWNRMDAVSAR